MGEQLDTTLLHHCFKNKEKMKRQFSEIQKVNQTAAFSEIIQLHYLLIHQA